MTTLATRSKKLSGILAFEEDPEHGVCREAVTVVIETGMDVGAALVRTLISPTGTAAATVGTGNGVMGTITVSELATPDVYTLRIVKAVSNAGDFTITNSHGVIVSTGSVAVAHVGAGMSFTLADGSTDFIVGDTIAITVAGTTKYKWVEAADVATLNDEVAMLMTADADIPSMTAGDNTCAVLIKGDAGIVGANLTYKDTLSAGQKAIVLAKFKAKRILNRTAV
jgi:hypothetical protein